MSNAFSGAERYSRQVLFDGLGPAGQHALMSGRALIVGLGGMGSWTAELLARAGVGFLRLADADCVAVTNLRRFPAAGPAEHRCACRRRGPDP